MLLKSTSPRSQSRCWARRERAGASSSSARSPFPLADAAQDAHDGAPAGSVWPQIALQHARDLVRTPARMLIAQRENREDDVLAGAARARVGPPALLDQAEGPELPVASQPLV